MNMDGDVKTFDVATTAPVGLPEVVEINDGPKSLTEAQLREYAKATGVKLVKLKELRKRNILGDLVQKLGAAKHGSWMLVESEDMILDGIKQIDKAIDDYQHDAQAIATLMKTRAALVDLWLKAAQAHIKSRKDGGAESSSEKPQQMPFPPASPVQTNIQVNVVGSDQKGS